jgi:EAL domain-containing protein (putative c-di-GMP-specific phosphodiesterase class I)
MGMIVPVPIQFIRDDTRVLAEVRLLDEMDAWCREELVQDFYLSWKSSSERKDYALPFEIEFANDNDALMFKMRWL